LTFLFQLDNFVLPFAKTYMNSSCLLKCIKCHVYNLHSSCFISFYRTSMWAVVQFYRLAACQSKSCIRNLTFMHNINLTSGTWQDQNIYGQVWGRIQILCLGTIERPFTKWPTHWSKTRERSCHLSLVHGQYVLPIYLILKYLQEWRRKFQKFLHVVLPNVQWVWQAFTTPAVCDICTFTCFFQSLELSLIHMWGTY